jgi:hypothetical protein
MLRHTVGEAWSDPVVIADGDSHRSPPAIAATTKGVWIAWSEEKPGGNQRVVAEHWQVGPKPMSITIATDPAKNRKVVVSVDKAGNPWFAWDADKPGLGRVAVRMYDARKKTLGPILYPSTDAGKLAKPGKGFGWETSLSKSPLGFRQGADLKQPAKTPAK